MYKVSAVILHAVPSHSNASTESLHEKHGKVLQIPVWKLASLSHTKCYINITGHSYRKEGLHSEPYGHFTTMHIISREQKKSTHATESGRKIKHIKMCYEQI